MFKSLLYQHIK